VRRCELKEELRRAKPKTIKQLMEIANRWADGEDSVRTDRDYVLDNKEPEAQYDSGRRSSRNSDRRKRHKSRGHDGSEQAEFVAAQFPSGREGGSHGTGSRDRKPNREWVPKKNRDEGLQVLSPMQQLNAPCTFHQYKDENGILTSSHLLKDC